MCATGWVPYVPVAHRSARVSSAGVMAGSGGASSPVAVPGSCPSRSEAAAPAAHSAARLLSPKQPNAPAVASASSAAAGRRARAAKSSRSRYGRAAAIRSAAGVPRLRTADKPSLMAGAVWPVG